MKYQMPLLTSVLCVAASCVLAGSFDATLVPQDAYWVAHVDVAAFRGSTIGQYVMEQEGTGEVKEQWQQAEEMLGMDVREDLNAVTMYGTGLEEQDVVIWFRGQLNPETLAAQAAEQEQYESLEIEGHTAHSWVDTSGGAETRIYGVVLDATRGVMGPSKEQIEKALQVAAGESPDVTDGGISVSRLTGSGLLVAATADFSDVDLSEHPMLAQANVNARYFSMDTRESDGNLAVRIDVQQESVQEAQQTEEMLNGLRMMGAMQMQEQNPDLAAFLQAITVSRSDDTLQLRLSYPSEQLIAMIEDMEQAQLPQQ